MYIDILRATAGEIFSILIIHLITMMKRSNQKSIEYYERSILNFTSISNG